MRILRFFIKLLSFVPALIIMYIIFSFSAQDGTASSMQSYKVTKKIVSTADRMLDLDYIRKLAHFTEYFLLAVSVSVPLYVYGIRGIWLVITAGILCSGFAALDEFHQLFVQGRGASVRDVIIDSCGALVGIFIVRILGYITRKTLVEPLCRHKRQNPYPSQRCTSTPFS